MAFTLRTPIDYSQNFLKDPRLITSLLDKSSIDPADIVVEIGPGKGILTAQLAAHCKRVIAIEKDPRLYAFLLLKFAQWPNVNIQAGDFLHYRLPRTPYKVFANIPFNITSAIVTRLVTAAGPPEDAYLGMQKEAAYMYLGSPHENLRAVLLKPWFDMEIVHRFRRSDFIPEPRVDVVMLRLRKRGPPLVSYKNRQLFRDFVVYGFTTWRPTIGHILKSIFTWQQIKRIRKELEINLEATPTEIPFEKWLKCFKIFQEEGNAKAIQIISGSEERLKRQQNKLQKVHRTRMR